MAAGNTVLRKPMPNREQDATTRRRGPVVQESGDFRLMPNMHTISRMLAARIERLAIYLLGEPRLKSSAGWRWGSKGSLVLAVAGDKRGQLFDHEAGSGGDAIDLICRVHQYGRKAAWLWALAWLGEALEPAPLLAAATSRSQSGTVNSDLWAAIWRAATPAAGSPVERYLSSRGLISQKKCRCGSTQLVPEAPRSSRP